MAQFQVTTSELTRTVNDLTASNSEFRSRVTELVSLQENLAGMWQGDANTAFNAAFTQDKSQWDAFATLIDEYVNVLGQIIQQYENAEQENTNTARTRTY